MKDTLKPSLVGWEVSREANHTLLMNENGVPLGKVTVRELKYRFVSFCSLPSTHNNGFYLLFGLVFLGTGLGQEPGEEFSRIE